MLDLHLVVEEVRGCGLGYIRIWATPPRRLVFWDGAPSPTEGSSDLVHLRYHVGLSPLLPDQPLPNLVQPIG